VLHVATAHSGSARWIEIQSAHLREHITIPFTTWGSLAGLDGSHGARFDRIVEQKGPEAAKLNHLAVEISREAADEDLLMFLDPDAFPIADPLPVIEEALSRAPLLAVRRDENGDPQPHPCFCVTTVGAWRGLAGDWSDGYPFTSSDGGRATGLGANLLRRLELAGTPWVPLLRSNSERDRELLFAIYGEIVYHHGVGEISRAQRLSAPRPLPVPSLPGLATAVRRLNAAVGKARAAPLLATGRRDLHRDRRGWARVARAPAVRDRRPGGPAGTAPLDSGS
jgi:hypothetical protein